MKTKILMLIAILGVVLICADSAMAFTFNAADGDLSEWGVNPSTSQWVPTEPGVYHSPLIDPVYGTPEDTTGNRVYPGWGGQQFDAEALYLNWNDTTLYLALVTGFPNTGGVFYGGKYYSAGDIAIDFGNNGTYDYGIEIGSHAGNYGGLNGTVGDVYKNVNWASGTDFPGTFPAYMISGTGAGSAQYFAYVNTYYGEHWVVEMSIPKDVFLGGWSNDMTIAWTQSCGNDQVKVATPEPMSLSLLGLGFLGVIGAGIRRKKIA